MLRKGSPSGQHPLRRWLVVAVVTVAGATIAAETVIPKYTVIVVQLGHALSSKHAKVAETFLTHCPGPDCGGFPAKTEFVGIVTHVTPKTDKAPGKLEVTFHEAILPDGTTRIPIEASVAPPDPNASASKQGKKGGGTAGRGIMGAMVGAAVSRGDNRAGAIVGGFIGVASGASQNARANAPQDVEIPAGTKFKIMLSKPVTLGAPTEPQTAPK